MTHHRHPIVNHPRVWQPWYIAGEDKATVHPVDFSSAIDHRNNNNSDLNCHYEQLPSAGLRLKRRQHERRSTEKPVKRCFTEDLQKVKCYSETKENLSVCDYLSEADDDQQLSDEDAGKLVVDDNVEDDKELDSDEELKEDCGDDIKSAAKRDIRHGHRVNHIDSDDEGKNERVGMDERCMDRQVCRRMKENKVEEEMDDDEQTTLNDVDEQEGPLDMTTNNRNRNQNNDNPPRWSSSSSTSSSSPPAAVNMSPIFYSHPPRYNPYVSSAPPPPYHPLPHHHLSRPHSASPPPYLPPSYATSNHYTDALTANTTSNGHRNISSTSSSLRPAHTVQQHRPSVITCASTSTNKTPPPQSTAVPSPPAHHHHHHRQTVLNSNNVNQHYPHTQHHRSSSSVGPVDVIEGANAVAISRRTLSDPTASRTHLTNSSTNSNGSGHSKSRRSSEHARYGHRREILSGMCDPVIDEHFRRSLGKHYTEYLSSSSSPASNKTPLVTSKNTSDSGSNIANSTSSTSSISITGMSVDDHFAKALGETWLRLQNKSLNSASSSTNASNSPPSKPSSPSTSVASTYASSSASPKSVSPSPTVQPTPQRGSLVST